MLASGYPRTISMAIRAAWLVSIFVSGASGAADAVLHYSFENIEHQAVWDLSGNGYHGEIRGRLNVLPGGLLFTGEGALVIPAVEALNVGAGGFAVETVIEASPFEDWYGPEEGIAYILVGAYKEDPRAWMMALHDGRVSFLVRAPGGAWRSRPMSPDKIPTGKPVHITGARDEDGYVQLYVNGRLVHTAAGENITLGENIHVSAGGRMPGLSRPLNNVSIHELRLYARALEGRNDPILERGRQYMVEDPQVLADGALKPLGMRFNGREVVSRQQAILFEPGRENVFTVSPPSGPGLEVELIRQAPDGRRWTDGGRVAAGERIEFMLGPMTAPPVYEFEYGTVYRRGYELEIVLRERNGAEVFREVYRQGLSESPLDWRYGDPMRAGVERLLPGGESRVDYNPLYGVERAVDLRLDRRVLSDPDELIVRLRLNPGALVERLRGRLVVSGPDGEEFFGQDTELEDRGILVRVAAGDWPQGDYVVAFHPLMDNRLWAEGPSVTYRRRTEPGGIVKVCPQAPWRLERDPEREEIVIDDFRTVLEEWTLGRGPGAWRMEFREEGYALAYPGQLESRVLELHPGVEGYYAVYARGLHRGCLVQVGAGDLVRPLHETGRAAFVRAADLTGEVLRIYPFDLHSAQLEREVQSGLAQLRLVPVRAESVHEFRQSTFEPELPLHGVTDWPDILHTPVRIDSDQFAVLAGAQAELGLRTLGWSIGRSWLEYHTRLPGRDLFPVVPLDKARHPGRSPMFYEGRTIFINDLDCPLQSVLAARERTGTQIWPWLAMNRHYGEGRDLFASRWFLEHPRFRRWSKNAPGPDRGEVSYFFEEVRRERVEIFLEAAEMGGDGILVGTTRQVPMLLYNPEMVAAYRGQTGVNPLEIDAADGELYEDWIRWRADHFSEVLRMLRAGLDRVGRRQGRYIPIAVRIPSQGLFYNLAQGLDVEGWIAEGLVDRLQLNPLEDCGGRSSHDVRPYIELGRRHGLEVVGGIGVRGLMHTASFYRALGLAQAGVDGLEFYATEYRVPIGGSRWLVPLYGNPERLRAFLENTNIEAVDPVTAATAMAGYDNHSGWWLHAYNVYGKGGNAL